MHMLPIQNHYLAKQITDTELKNLIAETPGDTNKLTHAGKLSYVNDDYCEITRNHSSFYGMNILYIIMLLPLVILSCLGIIMFLYYMIFDFKSYAAFFWQEKSELLLTLTIHFGVIIILTIAYFSSFAVNYCFFSPRHYPIRFNRKTGKVYICEYVFFVLLQRPNRNYKARTRFPFYKRTRPEYKEFSWDSIKGYYDFYQQRSCICCHVYQNENIADTFTLISEKTIIESEYFNNYKLWAWVNHYMDFKDEMLDMTVNPNVGIYGRKVEWPEAMLKKSTASSLEEYEKIAD
ncbi:hypothetical protein YA27_08090 [Klebsiella aerogenes]|nr:hypothetical protein YA27_08090 [Klebsiella aerogenes]